MRMIYDDQTSCRWINQEAGDMNGFGERPMCCFPWIKGFDVKYGGILRTGKDQAKNGIIGQEFMISWGRHNEYQHNALKWVLTQILFFIILTYPGLWLYGFYPYYLSFKLLIYLFQFYSQFFSPLRSQFLAFLHMLHICCCFWLSVLSTHGSSACAEPSFPPTPLEIVSPSVCRKSQ